jgi:glycosyltransferase involved in cell wall biosynthesis
LFPQEWRRELAFDAWLALWRRRPDAGHVVLFDEYAVRRLEHRRRAPIWLPEAPVVVPDGVAAPAERAGVALGGALAWRKGIEQLAAAVASAPTDMRVTLAGRSVPGYEDTVREQVERMRAAGAAVDLRDRWLGYDEYLQVFASAKVVAAPYPRHRGSSRLIVEAAAVGTPVVADRYGLLGRRVRDHGIGLVVDGDNPRELRNALDALLADDGSLVNPEALRRFAEQHTAEAFAGALNAAVAR